uniref:Uncharacterized protein n=1 Tax=Acrobeloides nanus TaxID=290746 RepID=A0A914CXQ3_9BILA
MDLEIDGDNDDSDRLLNIFGEPNTNMEPTHGTNHVEEPPEELSTVIGVSMDFENRLDEATAYEQNYQSMGGGFTIGYSTGSDVTDRDVFRTSNFDQIRPDSKPSIAPKNEEPTIHFDKSIETTLRSLFEIFLHRSVPDKVFDSFLKQEGLKPTNDPEEQTLQDILHEPGNYNQNLVNQACLEFCLGRFLRSLQQENLQISDAAAKTLHYQKILNDFALALRACEQQEIQISQEYELELWSEIFPKHQVTPKLPQQKIAQHINNNVCQQHTPEQQRANKRSHAADEYSRRHDPASHTPPKRPNTIDNNNSLVPHLKLSILDKDVEILKNVENKVELRFLIPCALKYRLKKDPEIFMAFTYSQRSDSRLIFWIETESNVITSVWNTNHNNKQNSVNREVNEWTCHYECQGCDSAKNGETNKTKINTILLSMLIAEKKITIKKTPQTTEHNCGECIPEIEENLQSKQTSKAGNKSQEGHNLLEILSQHCIMKIRTAIINGETVTSPDKTKKVSVNQAARQRLSTDLNDMLLKVRSLEEKCFPEGFAIKFEKHKLNLKLDRVQKFEQAFRLLKLNAYWCSLIMEEITQSRTIDTKTAFKISTELPYHQVFKATYQDLLKKSVPSAGDR